MTWIGDVNITINNGDDSEQKATIETVADNRAPINHQTATHAVGAPRASPVADDEKAQFGPRGCSCV